MADLFGMLQAASGSGGGEPDPFFNQTTLLLHGDGTNGAQNNTFLDSSTNNFTITRNGNTTQGTFSPFSLPNGEWSNFFDGTGDYLTAPDNVAYTFGTSDFTVEGWVFTGTSATQCLGGQGDSAGSSSSRSFLLYASISGNAAFSVGYSGNNNVTITSSTALPLNQWNHVAGVRDGATLRLYLNGVEVATGNISTASINDSGNPMTIGRPGDFNGEYLTGYCSNFRIVKGTCLYPSGTTFTPSTSPLTAISGTSLLTCQSNRFVDNSTNAFAITVNGNTSVQPFSPFAPSAAYSASVNGGSGYFDTSGDSLTVPYGSDLALGTGDCTIEAWVYFISYPQQFSNIIDVRESSVSYSNDAISFGVENDGTLTFYAGSYSAVTHVLETASGKVSLNTWVHLALTRSSGTTKLYVNGVEEASSANAWNQTSGTATTLYIGNAVLARQVNGYISNVRIVKGTAITPPSGGPTSPLTAISGTELLCNFTNAGIFDNTGKNVLETVGNAQIDTTTKKYGTGAMEFDGTGDYLQSPATPNLVLGSGSFTIEFWIYTTVNQSTNAIVGNRAGGGGSDVWVIHFYGTNNVIDWHSGAAIILTATSPLSLNTWNHFAAVRSGTTLTFYINGVASGSTTDSNNYSAVNPLRIGYDQNSGALTGFIDDLRITKGVARYTANFSVPTEAFPDL